MEALLKRYHTKLQYFVGSIMNIDDLKRVEVLTYSILDVYDGVIRFIGQQGTSMFDYR